MSAFSVGVEEEKPSKYDWREYFRVESYKRRGKGSVWRVVRIRDEQIIHRLVKTEKKAIDSVIKMLEHEVKTVEKLVERTILG